MWLKDRKVVYIPKPGKTPDRVGNLRPLSLWESLYKIQTRVLSDRLLGVMDEISYQDQHGFRRIGNTNCFAACAGGGPRC